MFSLVGPGSPHPLCMFSSAGVESLKSWQGPRSLGTLLTALILVAGSALSAFFYMRNRESTLAQMQELVVRDAVAMGNKVRYQLASYQMGMATLQTVIENKPGMKVPEFHELAIKSFPSLQPQAAVLLAGQDKEGITTTRIVHGSPSFAVAEGEPLASSSAGEVVEAILANSGNNNAIQLVDSLEMANMANIPAIIMVYPAQAGEEDLLLVGIFQFEGLLRTAIDTDAVLSYDVIAYTEPVPGQRKLLAYMLAGYRDDPKLIHFQDLENSVAQNFHLAMGDQAVRIAFSPSTQWLRKNQSPLPQVIFILGMGITAALAALFVYKSRRAQAVEAMVLDRTAELAMANMRLDESRGTLASLLEACPDAIIGKDSNGRWTFANRAFLDLAGIPETFAYFGLKDSEVLKQARPINGDLIDLQHKLDAEVLRSGRLLRREGTLEFVNGARRYLDIHMLPVRGSDGTIVGVVAVHNDITELRRRIIELQRSRERVKLLVENTATAIIEWDEQMRAINWNPAAAKLFGYDWNEVEQQPVSFFADPDDTANATQALESSLRQKRDNIPQVFRHLNRRGEPILCEWQNTPLVDEDGATLGVTSFIYDVTERTKAEQALRKRDSILRGLAGSTIGFLNADSWEPEASDLLRHLVQSLTLSRVFLVRTPQPEEGGHSFTLLEWINPVWSGKPLMPPKDAPIDRDPHVRLVEAGLGNYMEASHEHFGASSSFETPVQTILDAQGVRSTLLVPLTIRGRRWGFLRFDDCQAEREWSSDEVDALRVVAGVLAGAIARQVLTRERLGMEKRLLLSQKRESLGLLAGGIARDFNTIINNVLGSASLGRTMAETDSAIDQCLANIEEGGLRAASLCRQMLAYAGQSDSQAGLASPNLVVLDVLNAIDAEQHRRILFRKDLANGIPVVEGDIEQLRQALHAVTLNAIEAIGPHPGLVEIRTRPVTTGGSKSIETVEFTVRDTGPGMDARVRDRIFDPFFSTKMTGRGLGLTVAQSILEAHGGQITVESEPGAGTTVRLVLPCRRAPHQQITSGLDSGKQKEELSGTVLVVHNGSENARAAVHTFRQLGFRTEECGNIEESLRQVGTHPDRFRLVAVDPMLPGAEPPTLNRLRQSSDDTSVIILGRADQIPAPLRNFADEGFAVMLRDAPSLESLRGAVKEAMSNESGN